MASTQQNTDFSREGLKGMHQLYAIGNPLSRQLFERSLCYLSGGDTRTVLHAEPYPLVFESAQGGTLTSVDGDTYVDFLNDYSAGLLGHSNPDIQKVLQDTLSKGLSFGGHNRHEKELAAKIVQRFGKAGVELVRFTNSGTEANIMALAAAMKITGRSKILVFTGGYHGGAMSFPVHLVGGEGRGKQAMDEMANLPHEWVLAPFNNMEETRRIIHDLPPDSLAAILVETLQGAGGCRPATKGFLQFLRQAANAEGSILIVDEVMTSRLGHAGHLASMGLRADILTLGKYIGGGMSFGALGGRRDIMVIFDPDLPRGVKHSGTFNNNVLSMAAANAALDILTSSRLDELNRLGAEFKQSLQSLLMKRDPIAGTKPSCAIIEIDSFEKDAKILVEEEGKTTTIGMLPWICVTGLGSLLNLRFNGHQAAVTAAAFYHFMLRRGIYLAPRGYMSLSLETTPEHIALFLSCFEEFVG